MGQRLQMCAAAIALIAAATFSPANTLPHRADAGAAIRSSDTEIDVDATITRLVAMHCDGYLYDIPHGTDAWAKLPAFADAAANAKIDVYVYLSPWTIQHHGGHDGESAPFGTDYLKWCAEIGKLAAAHANIRGVVMDDFQSNISGDEKFTPDSVRAMRSALREERDDLVFLPVLYFDLPVPALLEQFGSTFGDGAILSYPRGRREVETMRRLLNDEPRGASFAVELPRKHRLHPGEGTFAGVTLGRDLSQVADRLQFFLDDQNATTKRGRHRVVVRVDGRIVWSHEVSAASVAGEAEAKLGRVHEGSRVEIGVIADEPSEEAPIHISCDDVRIVDASGKPDHGLTWRHDVDDGIRFDIVQPERGLGRWKIPMTLLFAGASFEHEKRFKQPGTAENISHRALQAVEWCDEGLAGGIVAWYAPLKDDDAIVHAIGSAFASPPTTKPSH